LGGAVNLPIIQDVLAARIAYQHWNRQGYGDDPTTGQHPGQDHDDDVVRLSVRFDPLSNLTSSSKLEFINMDQVGYLQTLVGLPTGGGAAAAEAGLEAGVGPANGLPLLQHWINAGMFTVGSEAHLSDKVKTWHAAEDVTWDINADTKLRSITGYHYVSDYATTDLDGTPYQILEIFAGAGATQPRFGTGAFNYTHPAIPENIYHQYTQEFNLSGHSFGRLDWLVGAFGSWEHGYGGEPYVPFGFIEAVTPPPNGPGGTFVSTTTNSTGEDTSTWAFFTQNDVHLSDRVSVTFGARYTEEKETNNSQQFNWIAGNYVCADGPLINMPAPNNNPNSCSTLNQHEKANGISYLLSFNYQITPQSLLYIKTSRGFRGGALQFRAAGFPAARPEYATDYEIGYKSDFFEHRLRANLAVYHTNYANKQEDAITTVCGSSTIVAPGQTTCPDGTTPHSSTVLTNAGTATVDGAEAEITAAPIEGLTITETTTYLFGKYTSFPNALNPDGGTVDATGQLFQDPTWRYSIGARYEHEFGPGTLAGSLDWSYRSANHLANYNTSPSFSLALQQRLNQDVGLLDGRLDYTMPKQGITVAFWATNLLNKNYQTEALFSAALGIATATTQPPRMYGLTFTKSFGGG
jgi:iron complex outermembrane receptor protein